MGCMACGGGSECAESRRGVENASVVNAVDKFA
jgi:hypothetical protein